MDKNFDVKEMVEKLVKTLQNDKNLLDSFQNDPVQTIEKLTGIDLPDAQLKPLITGIKAKLAASGAEGLLGGIKKLL